MSPLVEAAHASIPAKLTSLDHFAYLALVLLATNLHYPLNITTNDFFPLLRWWAIECDCSNLFIIHRCPPLMLTERSVVV